MIWYLRVHLEDEPVGQLHAAGPVVLLVIILTVTALPWLSHTVWGHTQQSLQDSRYI